MLTPSPLHLVVLTMIWCELIADPKLFNIRQKIISRDHKILGILVLLAASSSVRSSTCLAL